MKAKKFCAVAVFLLFVISVLCTHVSASSDKTVSPSFETDGRAACVYDVTHSRFLYSKNLGEVLNTSTSAKVMMGLVACEQLSQRLEEKITVTEKMLAGVAGYSMKLKVGEEIKIKDLLYGAICASYNDAAYVLANVCSGSTQAFVDLMNSRAKELGALSTSYTNPVGYPDNSAMITTLSDTVKIAEAAYGNELYMEICSRVSYSVAATNLSSARSFYNRNYLLSSGNQFNYYNSKCRGMNAGISGEAGGWSVVTVAKDDGADLICIVLGGTEDENAIYAYDTVDKLVDWACAEYNLKTVFEAGDEIGTTDVGLTSFGSQKAVYVANEKIDLYISKKAVPSVTYQLVLDGDELNAPITAGDRIGVVNIYCDGVLSGTAEVSIKESYELNTVMLVIDKIGDYTKSRAFLATIVCFVILLPTSLVLKSRRSQKRGGYRRKY